MTRAVGALFPLIKCNMIIILLYRFKIKAIKFFFFDNIKQSS